jgi:GNAT superfamily N-acetyltransferase
MSAAPEVESGDANIRSRAISTIVLGFAADPMARWVWPDASEYLKITPRFFDAFGGRAFEHGTAYVTSGARAAALWLPPGIEPDEAEMDAIMEKSLRPEIAEDITAVIKGMAEHHPSEPHWYLPLIAADPSWVGQGLGTSLMKHALDDATRRASRPTSKARTHATFASINASASRSPAESRAALLRC